MEEACRDLVLSPAQIQEVYSSMLAQINLGLGRVTNQRATVKCFPTYVKELPNGHGTPRALARGEGDGVQCHLADGRALRPMCNAFLMTLLKVNSKDKQFTLASPRLVSGHWPGTVIRIAPRRCSAYTDVT